MSFSALVLTVNESDAARKREPFVIARPVTRQNSDVNGIGKPFAMDAWERLDFDRAQPRNTNPLIDFVREIAAAKGNPVAPITDLHLDTPIVEEGETVCRLRVRPQWDVGDTFWVQKPKRKLRVVGLALQPAPEHPIPWRWLIAVQDARGPLPVGSVDPERE
jgi:hypothetical protein